MAILDNLLCVSEKELQTIKEYAIMRVLLLFTLK